MANRSPGEHRDSFGVKIEALLDQGSQLRTTMEITGELAFPGALLEARRVRSERRARENGERAELALAEALLRHAP